MLEEKLSAETQLAVVNYNEALAVLEDYFDRMEGVSHLSLALLTVPENYRSYCLPSIGTWEKNGSEGSLVIRFDCVLKGLAYKMSIELNQFQPDQELINLLTEARFSVESYIEIYSPIRTTIELNLVR